MKVRILAFLFLLLAWSRSTAQYFDDDARLWLYVKLNKKVTDRWLVQFILQNRFNNNVSEYSQLNGNLELNYKVAKPLKLIAGFVYGKDHRIEGYYNTKQQIYLGFQLKHDFDRWTVKYRNLTQAQTVNVNWSLNGTVFTGVNRNKFTLTYEVSQRIQVYMAEEITLPFYRFPDIGIKRYRTFFGTEYDLNRRSKLETYFAVQLNYSLKNLPKRSFIYGLTWTYKL